MNPELAYVKENLFLPKKYLNGPALLRGLTYLAGNQTITLAKETDTHIIVPRNYKSIDELKEFAFETVIEPEKTFPKIEFNSKIKWRSTKQEEAHKYLSAAHSGIFNLNPGRGKTVHALKRIEELSHPALIVVTNSYLAKQWINRIEDPNIALTFDGEIGQIGGGEFNWQQPICIAMIQTLANRIRDGKLPPEFSDWFGSAYYDEGHHIGAKVFSTTADVCHGRRVCLTATPNRADGLDCVLKYHMGDIIYSDLTWELSPEIIFKNVSTKLKLNKKVPMPVQINKLTEDLESNIQKLEMIKKDIELDRKIICMSERIEQLEWFHKHLPGSVLVIGETDPEKRESLIREAKVSLVIMKLGLEGLDVDTLDCLHLLSPIGADKTIKDNKTTYIGNRILQLMGRVMRVVPGKPNPRVVLYDNHTIDNIHDLTIQLKRFLKGSGFNSEEID
jgi:superfamily II DNA or RNA helicase